MQTPVDGPMDAESALEKQVEKQFAQWWWLWLVLGIFWILASVVVLQFRAASLVTVGVVIGIVLVVAGIQEFFVASVSGGWKWLWIAIGVFLVIGGIWSFIDPIGTFLALADTLGFLFVLIGMFWIVEAFATESVNPVWWLGLISGIIMVVLGFWTGGQFFATRV